jgi:hypothetical protein
MHIHSELNALAMAAGSKYMEEDSPLQDRYNQLMKLEEQRAQAFTDMNKIQENIKRYFDQNTTFKYFQKDQLVLL